MNISLTVAKNELHNSTYGVFKISNTQRNISYSGTLYDYNQIQFVSKSGGMVQWLQDYMNFEESEAIYIAEQLNNWQHFINTTNNKE